MSASQERRLSDFLAKIAYEPNTGCWLWTGSERKGYGCFWDGTRNVGSHRWAYGYFVADPGDLVICHRCDTSLCVNPEHLFAGTIADNNQDMRSKDRHARGQRCGSAKLTRADVRQIRRDLRSGVSMGATARKYGVSGAAIRDIRDRHSWRHVA